MTRLRAALALVLVLAGSIAVAYPVLAYTINGERNRRLTAAVEAALVRPAPNTGMTAGSVDETRTQPEGDPLGVAGDPKGGSGDERRSRAKPILNVAAPRDGQALGVIQIPSIGVQTVFLEGTARATLLVGPGHLPWTSTPGTGGISVLAAHRDLQFADLHEVRYGDRIWLQLPSGTLAYKVVQVRVTTPEDLSIYASEPGRRTELRLLTCWPPSFIGPAPDRLVVSAVPISGDLAPAPPLPSSPPSAADQPVPASEPRIAPVALPEAPSSGVTELIPMLGAAGVGLSSLASIATTRGGRRRVWFFAFLTGGLALNVALTLGLGS